MNYSLQVVWHYVFSPYLLVGVLTTAWLTLAAMAVGLAVGLIAAFGRISRSAVLRLGSGAYVFFFRGIPLLVLLILFYTGLPQIGIRLSALQAAVLGLGLNEGAYMCEIIRAGILSVDVGQMEASSALGMTYRLAMRRIIVPQAVRVIIPPTGNQFIAMLKNTSLVSTIAVSELLLRTENIISVNFRTLELLTVAAFYYLLLTSLLTLLQIPIEAWSQRGVLGAGKRSLPDPAQAV
ncbi:MAG: amino acid ABC transporter permease [Candidatus Dormibacteria bacterium]